MNKIISWVTTLIGILFSMCSNSIENNAQMKNITAYEVYLNELFMNRVDMMTLAELDLFIERGLNLSQTRTRLARTSPLMMAITRSQTGLAPHLLDYGAGIQAIDDYGNTALGHALYVGNYTIAKRLVEMGARTDIVNYAGDSILDIAARRREDVRYFSMLLDHGAPVSPSTMQHLIRWRYPMHVDYDSIPLLLEAYEEQKKTMDIDPAYRAVLDNDRKKLVKTLKDWSWDQEEVERIFGLIAGTNNVELARFFFDGEFDDLTLPADLMAKVAVNNNRLDMVKLLQSYDVDMNKPGILEFAVGKNFKEMAEYLLTHGVTDYRLDMHDRGEWFDLLTLACQYADMEMVNLLMRYGVGFNPPNGKVLHQKIIPNDAITKMNFLKSQGFNPAISDDGDPFVMNAAIRSDSSFEVFKWAVDNTDNPEVFAGESGEALVNSLINDHKYDELVYLLDRGVNFSNSIVKASNCGNPDILKLFLEQDRGRGDPKFYDAFLTTAATNGGYENMIAIILDLGADINFQSKVRDGDTALMCAIRNNYLNAAEYLLSHGADTARQNAQGKTALDLARELKSPLMLELLETGKINREIKYSETRQADKDTR